MRWIIKRILSPIIKPIVLWYLKKQRRFSYENLTIKINPGVFHPGLFISTGLLINFIKELDLKGKSFLELGAGSGAVGFFAEQFGAKVTLSDISPIAVDGLNANAESLKSKAKIVESDLFANLDSFFDYVIINPPYYPKRPNSDEDMAWFCGEDFEYFKRLFYQLQNLVYNNSKVFMILSEDCELAKIKNIAAQNNLKMIEVKKLKKWFEWNYIFQIESA